MRALDIILKKRDGFELSREEIQFIITGYVDGSIPEYQVSSWLMAVYFQGMSERETGFLTREMIESGKTLDLSGLPGPFVDKHSTGGVGDKVSLILAPLAASCGLTVPMMSGRALGHTGGTLDKLESIPGYSTSHPAEKYRQILKECSYGMTGQSKDIVPADRLMYGLRDVTGTVESVPLITASILSKKFAEGAEALIFDVKCGSGAFMKDRDSAQKLADSLTKTGKELGRKVISVITSMEQPLGRMVGNFLEAEESYRCLSGEGPADLMEVTLRLTAWMAVAGGVREDLESALTLCREKLASGEALERFKRNITLQGGDYGAFVSMLGNARAARRSEITAERDGVITGLDAFSTGMASVYLGAGRDKAGDPVEDLVGIELLKKRGDRVKRGDPLCVLWAESEERLSRGKERMKNAYTVGDDAPEEIPMIIEEVEAL
ncbi:MAG: thymidine phosphorylase [Spirochaetia bacterium]